MKLIYSFGKHAFLAEDLYAQVNPAKWNITRDFAREHGACRTKAHYCGRVLVYLLYLIVLDIIENNATFEFPLIGNKNAYMHVKCLQDDAFKQAAANGAFTGIDVLASEFKGYRLVFQWYRNGKSREKPFYVNGKIKKWFYHKINNGKQYY